MAKTISKNLTNKEKLFCDEFIRNGRVKKKATNFAKSAGCKSVKPKMILETQRVQEYIDGKMQVINNHVELTVISKLQHIQEIINNCMKYSNYDTALKAIAEANKMQGHYSAEKVVNFNIDANQALKDLIMVPDNIKVEYKRDY